MGKQSELIITKGQEFKIVVKDSIKEDDVFIDQYEQAAGMLNTIVAESIAAGERAEKSVKALYSLNEYENNIIAFCGERGEGKSSAMLTFINSLYTNLPKTLQGDDKFYAGYPELRKVHFSAPIIIDPSQFDDVHNILDIILAKIYRNFDRIYEENNRCVDEYDVNRLQNQFQKVYREVSMINNQSKMLDDEFDYEGNIGKLSKLGESTDLKEDLQELIKQYLAFIKKCSDRENEKERLIIAIDDLDLCNSNAYKMAEQIRKYLIIPQIIIIMAVKIEQLELCVEENTIAEFKGVVSTEKRQAEEKQNRIGVEIQGMSERYVAKLIPKARRIYLPKAQSIEDIRVIYKEKDTEEKKGTVIWESETNENLVKAVLDLIRERTGMIFLPEKSGMSYLLPDNLRDMVNWIVFVADMKKVCIPQKEDESKKDLDDAKIQEIYLKNIRSFIQYFNGEWITRQVPGMLGNKLHLMEKMDNFHLNMNAQEVLHDIYGQDIEKVDATKVNIEAERIDSFWKVMQYFLKLKKSIYDFDRECKIYGLKVLYTMKINQWIREKKEQKVSGLIDGYVWGSEFEGVMQNVRHEQINRSRFEMELKKIVEVLDECVGSNFVGKINFDSQRQTLANVSSNEKEREKEITTLILLALFSNPFTSITDKDRKIITLNSNQLIAGNRQIREKLQISLENYIVNLCDLKVLVKKINANAIGVSDDEVESVVSQIIENNKKSIEYAQRIISNMDVACELVKYWEDNKDYKSGTEDKHERNVIVVKKFFENIKTFFEDKTEIVCEGNLLEDISIPGVSKPIPVADLYAKWIDQKNLNIENEKEKREKAFNTECDGYRKKITEISNQNENEPTDFAWYFQKKSAVTVERLKIQLENCAKSISYYNGKNKQYPDKLDIDALCELYKDALELYNKGKDNIISEEMRERYKDCAGRLRPILFRK